MSCANFFVYKLNFFLHDSVFCTIFVIFRLYFTFIFSGTEILTDRFREQPSTGVLIKSCSEKLLQIYRRTVVPVNLLHIFKTLFCKITYGKLLLCLRKPCKNTNKSFNLNKISIKKKYHQLLQL